MSVYDVNGNPIGTVYGITGSALSDYYDVNGDSIKPIPDLTVMTYNVAYWSHINSQADLLTALISKYDPDIVGVQESSNFPSASQPFTSEFDYSAVTTSATNRNGLLSKIAMASVTEVAFTYVDTETWSYQKCYITVGGKTVAWYNTHLTWQSTSAAQEGRRLQTAQLLADAEEEDYVIITGDFNVWGHSMNSTDYTNVYKPFADAGYKMINFDTANHCIATWGDATAPTSLADLTDGCDNIIVSPNIDFIDVWFDDTKLSYLNGDPIDHIPLVATIKVN